MNNFGRVVRLALRHRLTIAGTLLSALAVAVLWGGNIGAVYPFMKVIFEGKSLQQWVDAEIVKARHNAAELSNSLETQQKELAAAPPERRTKLESNLATTQSRLAAEQRAEWWYVRLKPYLDRYLPEDPFQTVALIAAALFLGTVLKDLFCDRQQRAGGAAGAVGRLRAAEAVLSPHAADGPGHFQRRRDLRPDEPLHPRHAERGRRAWRASSASWSASR